MIRQQKPSSDGFKHFGIKGMHWGHHKTKVTVPSRSERPKSKSTPERPRETSTKVHNRPETAVEKLVSRAINQGYERATQPAMQEYVHNIPSYKEHSDPRINALLNRTLNSGLDRTEAAAGADFLARLPQTHRQ